MIENNQIISLSLKKKLFFRPYWGYGDWISINGMIRFFSSKYDEVNLIVDGSDLTFLSNLYKDDVKIKFVYSNQIGKISNLDDYLNLEIWEQIKNNHNNNNFYDRFNPIGKKFEFDVLSIDDECYSREESPHNFIRKCRKQLENNSSAFYIAAGIPKEYRLDKFYYKRDFESEDQFFNSLNLPKEYVVICEYGNNLVDRKFIKNKDTYIININNISPKYFDVIKVIENAKEVHLIENSIALLVYHLQYKNLMKNIKINIHTYSRKEIIRKCISSNNSNLYLDMFLYPKLENWNFIYENEL